MQTMEEILSGDAWTTHIVNVSKGYYSDLSPLGQTSKNTVSINS